MVSFNPELALPIFTPVITNPVIIDKFGIQSIQFLAADIASCSQVKVRVTTNYVMTSYCRDFICNSVSSSAVEFINENNEIEKGYLLSLKPNKAGEWELLKYYS